MSEHEANEVMADIEALESSPDWDTFLLHLYELHRLRDRYFYAQLSGYPEASEIYKQVTEMQTW